MCSNLSESSTSCTSQTASIVCNADKASIFESKDCIEFIKQAPRKKPLDQEPESKEDQTQPVCESSVEEECDEIEEEPTFGDILPLSATFDFPIDDLCTLCFTETLLISKKSDHHLSENNKLIDANDCLLPTVGAITLNTSNEDGHLCSYISAQYSTVGNGSRRIEIISTTDASQLLQSEKREDTSCTESGKTKDSLLIYKDNGKYFAVQKCYENNKRKKRSAELTLNTSSGDLIPSGLNFLLLRYVAQQKFCGRFQAWTVNMNGNICLSNYDVEPARLTRLCFKRCYVVTVHRIIKRFDREDVHETYHFLPTGHLLQYESCFSDYVWHVNPESAIPPVINEPFNVESKLNKDFRLLAAYLKKKDRIQSEMEQIVEHDRPDIKEILRDYLCQLVHEKPGNVMNYTLEYFNELRNKLIQERCGARSEDDNTC